MVEDVTGNVASEDRRVTAKRTPLHARLPSMRHLCGVARDTHGRGYRGQGRSNCHLLGSRRGAG